MYSRSADDPGDPYMLCDAADMPKSCDMPNAPRLSTMTTVDSHGTQTVSVYSSLHASELHPQRGLVRERKHTKALWGERARHDNRTEPPGNQPARDVWLASQFTTHMCKVNALCACVHTRRPPWCVRACVCCLCTVRVQRNV